MIKGGKKDQIQNYQISGKKLPPSTLQLVQIYFDTATFDDIKRDKKIKLQSASTSLTF